MWNYIFLISILMSYLALMSHGLTIREVSAEDESDQVSSTESVFIKSMAKVRKPSHRVPEHLQIVNKGFVYEDADDVIHVIDPPRHFEELKKIMQRKGQGQAQRPLPNLRPVAMREQRPKAKIFKTKIQTNFKGDLKPLPKKPLTEMDLETQETQDLPLEILASVRKTEKYLKKFKPKLPAVKQRLQTKKIQTVIWEKAQEQQQYQQGNDYQIQGIRAEQLPNRRHFNKKRFRRETPKITENQTLKGEKLLNHINDLIKNASLYLELAEQYEDYREIDLTTTPLQGEILFTTTKSPPIQSQGLSGDMVKKILENSVKATHVIMQQLKTQSNATQIDRQCDYLKVTYPNHIKNLQTQIKCMQNFIKDIKDSPQEQQRYEDNTSKPSKPYGERLESRRTKDLRHKPFLVAQLAADYADDTEPTPVNSSLIYNDVMTTIRNMLQNQNLQNLESEELNPSWEDSLGDTSFTYDLSSEPVDFHNLEQYLASLQSIVANLPKFSHKSLNLQEVEGGSFSKYYFINPQGSIYSLPHPFQKDISTPAPSTIFHQFPDLPLVKKHIQNGTLLPPSDKVVEIL